jgi:hypothetical protein
METKVLFLLVAALGILACTELAPGRCDSTSDCAVGLTCNLDRTPQGNGRCVSPADGSGLDGAAGGAGEGGTTGTGGAGHDGGTGGSDASMEVAPEVKPGCSSSVECPVTAPICDAGGACRPCNGGTVSKTACATLDASKPTCGANGQCVVCTTSADCKADPTKPICAVANQKCVACTADTQCVDKLGANPGICMSHQDGRCATDAETFYVSSQTGCSDTGANAGTSAAPFCTLDPAAKGAGGDRSVVVVRGGVSAGTTAVGGSSEVSIIGQQSAVIAAAVGPNALHLSSGKKLYVRDVSITAVLGVGILAESTSTLRLEHVTVSNSAKGGIQVGGAFDIANSTITGNGPGSDGGFFWGGIDVQFPPAGGPSRLNLVTVSNNKSSGVTCSSAITGTGVLAMGNGGDISATCGFASCPTAGPTCGAQP